MKIYTKTGDDGTTGLFAGPRVFKDDPRIAAYGSVDELNAILGVASIDALQSSMGLTDVEPTIATVIHQIQHDLFAIGAELATPQPSLHGTQLLEDKHIAQLEAWIDQFEDRLQPLSSFILPGGSRLSAQLHWARTVCRRAERDLVYFLRQGQTENENRLVVYLNRISDLLFVLARFANYQAGIEDVAWKKPDRSIQAGRARE